MRRLRIHQALRDAKHMEFVLLFADKSVIFRSILIYKRYRMVAERLQVAELLVTEIGCR